MMKVFEAQLLLVLVNFVASDEQPLVQCALPVHVKFIVTPEQLQPVFQERSGLGQKHWSAYKCKMNILDQEANSIAEVRQLQATSNSSDDDDNETTTTTTASDLTTTATATTTEASNVTTTATASNATNLSTLSVNETVAAEIGSANCWKTWGTGLLSLGLSLSLPVAEAAPGAFMMPSQPRKLDELTDVVEVLMPCSALLDPLKDLDGDGAFDCKMTQEQSSIALNVPEIDGTWRVLSAQSVSSGNLPVEHHVPQDRITIGGGAWCVDPSATARLEHKLEHLAKEELPLALTNVARFTHDGKPCSTEKPSEATMWSFDLVYPTSSCTPGVASWVQPCAAKLLPDGTLVLLRGAPVQSGSEVHRPPLMGAMNDAQDAISFAKGVAAATASSIEVLILHKHLPSIVVLPGLRKLQSDDMDSVSNSSNSSESDDNETLVTTTPVSTTAVSTTTASDASTTALNTTTKANLTDINETVNAEIGQASHVRTWSTAFICLALRFVVR